LRQAGLADACLPGQHHHTPPPCDRVVQGGVQQANSVWRPMKSDAESILLVKSAHHLPSLGTYYNETVGHCPN